MRNTNTNPQGNGIAHLQQQILLQHSRGELSRSVTQQQTHDGIVDENDNMQQRILQLSSASSSASSLSSGSTDLNKILHACSEKYDTVENAEKCDFGQLKHVQECVKNVIWPDFKFLTNNCMTRMLEIKANKNNLLDRLLRAMNNDDGSLERRIKFWKLYGRIVQNKLNTMRATATKLIKKEVIKGKTSCLI